MSSLYKRVAVLGAVTALWGFTGKLFQQTHLVPVKASNTRAQKGDPGGPTDTKVAMRI